MTGLTSQLFQFEGRTIRASLTAEGEPLFVAKDVCEILGLDWNSDVKNRIPEWAKGGRVQTTTLGGSQDLAAITEAGVYWIALKSKKTEAEAFQKWVCTEVLPAIRRDGLYALAGTPAQLPVAKLRLRLEAAELKARAKALEVRADRLSLPPPPEDYATIGQYLTEQGIEPGHPSYFSQCSYLGNALRGQPHAWTRGRDRKPRRAYPRSTIRDALEFAGYITTEA